MKVRNLVITGADGFIGRRFIERYGREYQRVTALVRSRPHPTRALPDVDYRMCDIADLSSLSSSVEHCDAIVHFAYDFANPLRNLDAARHLLTVCRNTGARRLVHLSTIAVYDQTGTGKMTEASPTAKYRDPYTHTKLQIEKVLSSGAGPAGVELVMLQPTIVFGWGGSWTRTALEGCKSERVVLPRGGSGVCNYVYVDDVCQAVFKALAVAPDTAAGGPQTRRYIISGPDTVSWREFFQAHCSLVDASRGVDLAASPSKRGFDDNALKNFIFGGLLRMPVAAGVTAILGMLRRLRPKGGAHRRALDEAGLLSRLRGESSGVQAFNGMPRLYINSDYTATAARAMAELDYRPEFDLVRGIRDVGKQWHSLLEADAATTTRRYDETVIDLDRHSVMDTLVGDVCVIGTGIGGGSFVSSYLKSAGGLVIIEAGNKRDGENVGVQSTGRDFGLAAYRDIAIGGTSKTWRGVCAPMDDIDFTRRAWISDSAWPIARQDLESYYQRASELLNLPDYEYYRDPGRTHAARIRADDFEFDRGVFVNKYFLQTRPPKNFHDEIFTWLPRRSDSVLVYNAIALELIMNRDGTAVETLLVKNNQGQTLSVQARKFVVCAGALETPRLLLNSRGAGDAGLGNAHGHVGCYLMDHPMTSVGQIRLRKPRRASLYQSVNLTLSQHIKAGVVMTDDMQRTHQLPNHCVYLLPSLSRGLDDQYEKLRRSLILSRNKRLSLPDVAKLMTNPNTIHWALSYLLPVDAYYRYADLYYISEQTPTQSSRVSLSSKRDRFGYPVANVNWVISDEDIASISRFNSLLLNAFPASAYEVTGSKDDAGIGDSLYAAAHFMGTARMSAVKSGGVVDSDLKVWDVANLYVCDGSVIPIAGNANPSLTIAALAVRLADHLSDMR